MSLHADYTNIFGGYRERFHEQTREQIQNQTIDEYLLEEEGATHRLCRRLKPLLRNLDPPNVTLVTYEEMVSNFGGWLEEVIEPFEFGSLQKSLLLTQFRLKYRNEFRPDPKNSHKRNVEPGEHLRKLKPETIAELNRRLAPYLKAAGYE